MSIKKIKTPKGWRWQVDVYVNGKRHRPKLPTLELARSVEKKLIADGIARKYDLPVDSPVELSELINTHLESLRNRGRQTKLQKRALGRFSDLIGGYVKVETIKTADLNRYVDKRLGDGLLPQSVNRELTYIKSCLTSASRYYSTLEDWRSPKAPWLPEPRDGRRRTLTPDEKNRLLADLYGPRRITNGQRETRFHQAARISLGQMLELSFNTGMRPGEIKHLKWFDVNFDKETLLVRSKKGGRERLREVPMNARVKEILTLRAENKTSEYIFPGQKGGVLVDYTGTLRASCKRAGIPYGRNVPNGVVFYDARRTAENEMLDAGFSPRDVGEVMGHSIQIMTRHYARATPAGKRAAVESLGVYPVTTEKDNTNDKDILNERKKQKTPKK